MTVMASQKRRALRARPCADIRAPWPTHEPPAALPVSIACVQAQEALADLRIQPCHKKGAPAAVRLHQRSVRRSRGRLRVAIERLALLNRGPPSSRLRDEPAWRSTL